MFGSWTAAAASYNMGQEGMTLQRERQKAENYFNLVLNYETSRFVGRIIAFKYIMRNSPKYGFNIEEDDLYEPLEYYEVALKNSVEDFADFAFAYGINYYTLKLFNPWLRENYLKNNSGKSYTIKLPEEGSIEIIRE